MRSHYDVTFCVPGVGTLLRRGAARPAGGAETQALALARALTLRGLSVALIAYGAPDELPAVVDGIHVIARAPYRPGGGVRGKLTETTRLWRSLQAARARVYVTRCAGIQVGLIAAFCATRPARLVFSAASDADFEARQLIAERPYRALYEWGARRAEHIVVQTERQLDLCRETFAREACLIRSIAFPGSPSSGEPEAFLWVGRIAGYKRPLRYVELARRLPEGRFWMVVVPGASTPENEALSRELEHEASQTPNLELLPPRPQAELFALVARAVATVNTSDFEGMPNTFLEAWAHGIPALSLAHDPNGVIAAQGLGTFADGSFDALVAGARQLWSTRRDRSELSGRCRTYVEVHHSPEAVAEAWERLLRPQRYTRRRGRRSKGPAGTGPSP